MEGISFPFSFFFLSTDAALTQLVFCADLGGLYQLSQRSVSRNAEERFCGF